MIHRTLFEGLVGCPARNGFAKKNAPAASFDASAYGTMSPGLESDQAAAVHAGGGPRWIGAGKHRAPALAEEDRTGACPDPPHAANKNAIAAVRQDFAPSTPIGAITPAAAREFRWIGTDRPAAVYAG